MAAEVLLFADDFADRPIGPLPTDHSARGEYHYDDCSLTGPWYDPNRAGWGRKTGAPWLVLEDEGARALLATVPADQPIPRLLVGGDDHWTDHVVTARLRPIDRRAFCGLMVRYRTARSGYRAVLDGDRAAIQRVDHAEVTELAAAEVPWEDGATRELTVRVAGDRLELAVDGTVRCTATDDRFGRGRVALLSQAPCLFRSLRVTCTGEEDAAWRTARGEYDNEIATERAKYPQPQLWKQFSTAGFGAGRHLRFGHLRGERELDIVIGQHLKLHPGTDAFNTVSCLTAVDLDGKVLWQHGSPRGGDDAGMLTADVPFQVHDLDGDGRDEVVCMKNWRLVILDGATGEEKGGWPLPWAEEEVGGFGPVTGDCLLFADLRGQGRRGDVVLKNRYRQLWAYTDTGELLWQRRFADWLTGHFAVAHDFDRDGRDEIFVGYGLLGPDGSVRWEHRWDDHTDEIAVGRFDPSRDDEQLALVCGWEGFNILAADGTPLYREDLGHAQRLSAARYRDDLPGVQFYVTTYWGQAGIVSFHDCTGKRLFEFEPTALGSIVNPVNWTGAPRELCLLSTHPVHGGLVDGHGRRVVIFPDDGHPVLASEAIDVDGCGRDEIVTWDLERLWIYKPDGPPAQDPPYAPVRYPHCNASDYRAEISLPPECA